MKRHFLAAATLAAMTLGAAPLYAQATPGAPVEEPRTTVTAPQATDNVDETRATDRANEARTTQPAKGSVFKLSDLRGMEIRNLAGEKLGDVNDIVIDVTDGRVRYAALSFGGFLGIGDKLFAVPWNAMNLKYDNATENYFFALDVDKEMLERAPSFDKDHWPTEADGSWLSRVETDRKSVV